jgi:hypothetical protein
MEGAAAADDDALGVFRLSRSKPALPKIFTVCLSKWRRDFHRPSAAFSRVRRDPQLAKMRPAAWAAKRAEREVCRRGFPFLVMARLMNPKAVLNF